MSVTVWTYVCMHIYEGYLNRVITRYTNEVAMSECLQLSLQSMNVLSDIVRDSCIVQQFGLEDIVIAGY
jgi:hypothetical protein